MTEAEKIVEGLTEAQRRAVLWLGKADEPIRAYRRTFSAVAAFNLIGRGVTKLTTKRPFGQRENYDHYSLTPLGLEVRKLLEAKP